MHTNSDRLGKHSPYKGRVWSPAAVAPRHRTPTDLTLLRDTQHHPRWQRNAFMLIVELQASYRVPAGLVVMCVTYIVPCESRMGAPLLIRPSPSARRSPRPPDDSARNPSASRNLAYNPACRRVGRGGQRKKSRCLFFFFRGVGRSA